MRKETKQKHESWEELVEKEGEKIERLFSFNQNSNTSAEDIDLVRELLLLVSERYRTILILREVDGLSYQELTEVLDCSIDSVKAKLRRARKEVQEKIRHLLEPSHV